MYAYRIVREEPVESCGNTITLKRTTMIELTEETKQFSIIEKIVRLSGYATTLIMTAGKLIDMIEDEVTYCSPDIDMSGIIQMLKSMNKKQRIVLEETLK